MSSQYIFQTEKVEDGRSGIPQIISNIEICKGVADFLSTTLGPYGQDKLFYGSKTIITNDGATILENMKYKHPVARMLVEVSKSQDNEVGDGTTSVVLLSSEILNQLSTLIRGNYSIDLICSTLKNIRTNCLEKLQELTIPFTFDSLVQLAEVSLNSKCIRNEKKHFAKLLVEGLKDGQDIYISKIRGGSLRDSTLVNGIAFEKTFTYAGYEQQPRRIENPKICCLNVELEWKSERENGEVRVETVEEYQKMVDAEWKIIDDKLEDIVRKGANIVLSSLPIGDYATQYFAARGVFSVGRVHDLERITKAFGGRISNSTKYVELGMCAKFEERQLGGVRYNYLEGIDENVEDEERETSVQTQARTLILRGPGTDTLEEIERSVHDAVCVIKTAIKHRSMLAGGGAVEMELSKLCREAAFSAKDERFFICQAVSKAFEKIPTQLAKNFGLDSLDIIQQLRKAHTEDVYVGVSLTGISSMRDAGIFEPLEIKKSMIKAAFNLVETVIRIDSTILTKK